MQMPFIEAGWTLAVLLGLYGFYCHWEAGRATLVAAFRQRTPNATAAAADAMRYRSRGIWALLGSGAMAGTSLLSAL